MGAQHVPGETIIHFALMNIYEADAAEQSSSPLGSAATRVPRLHGSGHLTSSRVSTQENSPKLTGSSW